MKLWIETGLTDKQKQFLNEEFLLDSDYTNNRIAFHMFLSLSKEKLNAGKVLDAAGSAFTGTNWKLINLGNPVSLQLVLSDSRIPHRCVIQINEIPPEALALASIRVDLPCFTKYVTIN